MESRGETLPDSKAETTPDRPPGELAWIREALNRLDGKFDKLDDRLRIVENKISTAKGWITAGFVVLVLLQLALRVFDVDISFRQPQQPALTAPHATPADPPARRMPTPPPAPG